MPAGAFSLGPGLAAEAGAKWVKVAHERTGQTVLHPENAASLHVIRKLGFSSAPHENLDGWEVSL